MTAVKQAACYKAVVRRHQTTVREHSGNFILKIDWERCGGIVMHCKPMSAEPNGGVEGAIPHDHHVPVVPELLGDTFPQQERLTRGKDLLLTSRRLFSGV